MRADDVQPGMHLRTNNAEEIERNYQAVRKLIDRLWSTYTPVSEIRKLYADLETARANELAAL